MIRKTVPKAKCISETIRLAGKDKISIDHVKKIQISLCGLLSKAYNVMIITIKAKMIQIALIIRNNVIGITSGRISCGIAN